MDTLTVSKKELKIVVRESVREALGEELATLRASLFSFVSDKEQKDIDGRYARPSNKTAKSLKISI